MNASISINILIKGLILSMKVLQLFESTLHIEELTSNEELQDACDLINDGAQLSWTLTPSRLLGKLGSSGKLFGLFDSNDMVGTIGLKETTIEGITGAEVGYLYIRPDSRSFNAYTLLYRAIRDVASNYQFIFATTVTTNKTINTLMKRNQYVTFGFSQKSPFSSNILNYWIAHGTKMSVKQVEQHLSEEYLTEEEEEDNNEDHEFKIILSNVEEAPTQFRNYIYKLADRSNSFEIGESVEKGQAMIKFGRRSSISEVENTIHFGNVYYNKQSQYNMLKGIVPTVPTFDSSDDVTGPFIAKRKGGQRQQGQLVNKVPENPEEYIFQPLLDIMSEYRVVVYYMNGDYHVSGIYKKTGSNASITSITSGEVYNVCKNIAIAAIKELGYGASGVDIAISKTEVSESAIGGVLSGLGKLSGKITRGKIEGNVYFLEANTMPSVSNPMILHDLVKSIKSNIK